MENKSRVAVKYHLIPDIMFSTLNIKVPSACNGQVVWIDTKDLNR
jgi:hypothetical protein